MDKASAQRLLTQTLGSGFEEGQFQRLVENLLKGMNRDKAFERPVQGQYIKESFRDQVRQYRRIGQYVDPQGKVIDVLWVRLKSGRQLEQARTMQRNFAAQYLQDRGEKDGALIAYVGDGEEGTDDRRQPWRFSWVRLEYSLDPTGKIKKEVTAARRSSFLVGSGEPSHTAQRQLMPLLTGIKKPSLEELEAAFSVEAVTDEFFGEYKALFLQITEEVEALRGRDRVIEADFGAKAIESSHFAKKLLGQLVFLYFLQKKGWLGVEPGQPWGSGPRDFLSALFHRRDPYGALTYGNFFNEILEPLFYKALALDRGSEALYPLPGVAPCKVPFLNGGLFEPVGGYDWRGTDILLENGTIEAILATFDRYNFTVREDEPLDREVAVDPEMLGKVFENLLEVSDRKSSGAFYTPREVVQYMCQESLIHYLERAMGAVGRSIPVAELGMFVRGGERWLEHEVRVRGKSEETKAYGYQVPESVRNAAGELDRALAEIKICDPAIGSGAFPVGLMQEIVKLRQGLGVYLQPSPPAPLSGGEGVLVDRSAYGLKRHAIEASIYGVDVDAGAVDIARLRLWLSLVVDEVEYGQIQPLPNLDYKIAVGNSLLGLEGLGERLENPLFRHDVLERLEGKRREHLQETDPGRKAALKAEMGDLFRSATGTELEFDFRLYFSEVFRSPDAQGGGFDVVIGNPPCASYKHIGDLKPALQAQYYCYTGTADLYIFFYEQGLKLLRPGGILTYVSPNTYFQATYGQKLRQFLTEQTRLRRVIDLLMLQRISLTIVTIEQQKPSPESWFWVLLWPDSQKLGDFPNKVQQYSFKMPQAALNPSGWQFMRPQALGLLEKLRKAGTPLGDYVQGRFYRGVLTGFNDAFVVDRATRDRLIAEHPSSAEVLKPFVRGHDVKRWIVDSQDLYLIKIESSENIEHPWSKLSDEAAERTFAKIYPSIYQRFTQSDFREKLIKRSDQGRFFWELRSCAYWQEFEQPKIFIPAISSQPDYALDVTGFYGNDKTNICLSEDSYYLAAILNSSLMWWFICQIAAARQGGFYELKPLYVTQIPIIQASPAEKATIETLVSYILHLTPLLQTRPSDPTAQTQYAVDRVMVRYFEILINGLIAELYLPDEFQQHQKSLFQHLPANLLPPLDLLPPDKLTPLRHLFETLYHKNHPIAQTLFFLDTIDSIKLIQSKAKHKP